MAVKQVCFVCLGNIVRSPLAEHLFTSLAEQRGIGHRYQSSSAGCGDWHVGEEPDSRMRRVAAQKGLIYTGRACQFQRSDFDRCDLILAMDLENRNHLQNLARNQEDLDKIHMLREYDPHGGSNQSVPDPYYGGIDGFELVYDVIERSVNGLLDSLENEKVA